MRNENSRRPPAVTFARTTAIPLGRPLVCQTSKALGSEHGRQVRASRNFQALALNRIRVPQRKADSPQQILKAWIAAQGVHAGIDVKVKKPVRTLLVALLQMLHATLVFLQTGVDSRKKIR